MPSFEKASLTLLEDFGFGSILGLKEMVPQSERLMVRVGGVFSAMMGLFFTLYSAAECQLCLAEQNWLSGRMGVRGAFRRLSCREDAVPTLNI